MSRRCFVVLVSCGLAWSVSAAGPTFRPDVVFKGSTLTGWTPLGDVEWKAVNGEIIGTPKQPGGGWLVLDKSFQDVAVFNCCFINTWSRFCMEPFQWNSKTTQLVEEGTHKIVA